MEKKNHTHTFVSVNLINIDINISNLGKKKKHLANKNEKSERIIKTL